MKHQSQRGVALVTTLVMLAVVTFMAVTFLAVSRRERSSVGVTEDQTGARLMAEAALARAEGEMISRMLSHTNLLAYEMVVSTNFIDRYGFNAGQGGGFNYENVNYDFRSTGVPLNERDRLVVMTNLLYDPRPPVYVRLNDDPKTPWDFRFYVDLNRNGQFETNGVLPEMNFRNMFFNSNMVAVSRPVGIISNYFVGDPEWIGVLQHPDTPHSASNRFIGRYAFLVQPMGKSLDFNAIHNNAQARSVSNPNTAAFYRDQGVGSWELNLAAFFRDLNTNLWFNYDYRGYTRDQTSRPFVDALSVLRYRYNYDYPSLHSVEYLFGGRGAYAFQRDNVDGYTDRPAINGFKPYQTDMDVPRYPWPGAENPRGFFDIQELFDPTRVTNSLVGGLKTIGYTNWASYNRYTFYRMLGQIGMDSVPANRDKINLNYDNTPPLSATNFIAWEPLKFFEVVASRLLAANRTTNDISGITSGTSVRRVVVAGTPVRPSFGLNNITVYDARGYLNNEYSASVHRLLQLAVNLYDSTTNRPFVRTIGYPTVLRPRFSVDGPRVYISGWREVTNEFQTPSLPALLDLSDPADRATLGSRPDSYVYGVPLLIGAKKGLPNFNEFSLLNVAQVTRKLEVRKPPGSALGVKPNQINQMYLLSISNQFGIEGWNSYTQDLTRPLSIRVVGDFRQTLFVTNTGTANSFTRITNSARYGTNIALGNWRGLEFKLPVLRSVFFLPESVFRTTPRLGFERSTTNSAFTQRLSAYPPGWRMDVTNRFCYALVDTGSGRLLDFASFADMSGGMDITAEIAGRTLTQPLASVAEPPNAWLTNPVSGPAYIASSLPSVPSGVKNQLEIGLGNEPTSEQQWTSYSLQPAEGMDKRKSIDRFRMFVGLTPLYYTGTQTNQLLADLRGKDAVQVPYSPTRKIYQELRWQANDPLVHYQVEDLLDPFNRPGDPTRTNSVRYAVPPQIQLTNSNLGMMNERYQPWGGNPSQSTDRLATDVRVKDPLIRRSDDWDFLTNKLPNIGWIGRVHRGTPWQTVYLKSGVIESNVWYKWAGSDGTHPTNDWLLPDLFTVAASDAAARGLLGVNQTNLAAWSAVFSGVTVLTNVATISSLRTNVEPDFDMLYIQPVGGGESPQLRSIVAGINRTRSLETNGVFSSLGRILSVPELTVASPYLNFNNVMNDAILERIPQQVLSLLQADQPRFAVYAFGQSLREAPSSIYLGPGPFNKLCTNYQVKGEFVLKAVVRVEGSPTKPRAVIESFNELSGE